MKEIILSAGKATFIDDNDFGEIIKYKWTLRRKAGGKLYAGRNEYANGKCKEILMHRFLLNLKGGDGNVVDHKDGDGLNNQRSNFRVSIGNRNNTTNSKSAKNSSSKYKGVHFDKIRKKWFSQIHPNRKAIFLGRFDSEIEAAEAYNKAAIEKYGEYAYLNDISKPFMNNEQKQPT